MYYGVQYYPEHWPEERWEVDAEMMQKAGVNTVRMGEFAWSAIEPEEGRYDFGWLDRAIDLLHRHGIRTLLCTMSRTPPPWVFKAYPEILNTPRDGKANTYGVRYTIGLAHEAYVPIAERIDRAVIEHYSGNGAIAGWQIDNEVGGGNDCYCPECHRLFQRYLEEKYGTIEALNKAWGIHFWSLTYSDFDEVPLPLDRANPQLALEYRRFLSKINVDFSARRYELIGKLDPGKWVTTNFQSFQAKHTDYFDLQRVIDVNGMNHYPFRSPELILDYYRGNRGKVLVLEQFTRLAEVDAGPGWMRLWAWMAVAHGASGINFFRWRSCRWGQEQHRDGLLPHGGQANRRYEELSRMGEEIRSIGDRLDATVPNAEVAIVLSYESRWALEAGLGAADFDGAKEAIVFHRELMRRNITVDAMDPWGDLSGYKLVIAPRAFCVDAAIAKNLSHFVESGGTLCLTAASGVVDEFNVSFDSPRPGPLVGLAGIEVDDLSPLDEPVRLKSETEPSLDGIALTTLADEVRAVDAEVVAKFDDGWRIGRPAVTRKSTARGQTVYLAASPDETSARGICDYLCAIGGVEREVSTPDGVRVYQRAGKDELIRFALNYTGAEQRIKIGPGWYDIFSGDELEEVPIAAVDVRILVKGI